MVKEYEIVGLIPAAGSGSRLYPFSKSVPKELYPIMGKPVIEYCIENLSQSEIKKIFVVVGHQKGGIIDYLGNGSDFNVDVAYLNQHTRNGLGGAILEAEDWISNSFVTLLGDSFIEPSSELKKIIEFHKKQKPIATILLFKVTDSTQYGVVKSIKSEFEGFDLISDVVEKPDKETAKRFENKDGFYAICGAYVFEPKIFSYLRSLKNGKELTDAIKAAINKGEKVYGRILDGKYLDMGKWKTVLATEKYMMENSNIEQRIKERETLMNKIRERSEK